MTTFNRFFHEATRSDQEPDGRTPYPFQKRFAEARCLPHLVQTPTGAGKTATAVLGWLWRWQTQKPDTPRRLLYCLPMRVLVEQARQEIVCWIANLGLDIKVHVLMGGIDTEDWHLAPDLPAILIGTQDMLLSRALNRGYGESRFHWPIDFGLLNNDCLWVFDEPQLMASGVSTSAQLAGLRKSLGTIGPCPSLWMSATLEPEWLETIDFRGQFTDSPLQLTDEDYDPERPLHKRMTAKKTLHRLDVDAKDTKDVAREVLKAHVSGTQTLVVLNTVERTKAVYLAIETLRKKSPAPSLMLVHSRFRPHEREQRNEQLQDKGDAAKDRIIVATQVVEAGVDISARTLITDLAPWSSIVQRLGRCNRTGDDGPGQAFWIDLTEKFAPPYDIADLDFARVHLQALEGKGVSPKQLDAFKQQHKIKLPFQHKHVLRRRDLFDLFDTAPDLSGNDIDIQRFVRGDDPDSDIQVFWRDFPDGGPQPDEPSPERGELCTVPVSKFRDFLNSLRGPKRGMVYLWDHLDGRWTPIKRDQLRPGIVVLLSTEVGGYSSNLGWDPSSSDPVVSLSSKKKRQEEATGDDANSTLSVALTIPVHTEHVCKTIRKILKQIPPLPEAWKSRLQTAARWHDVGKAHYVFQTAVRKVNPQLANTSLWAKSGTTSPLRYNDRHYFRHELASALAALQHNQAFGAAYLIAAHHGRARLAVRALPGEELPDDANTPFALGVQHGDRLPEVEMGADEKMQETVLDLSPMRLGADCSWTANALNLLAELGPFQLAYLESILRAADALASQEEAKHA
jgi:CRISPR-associated endonuclease/helicase Cas3